MELNLYRLRSVLHAKSKNLIKENDEFIASINDELFDDDIILKEGVSSPIDVVLIESGGSEEVFLKIFDKLTNPFILICNSRNNSLPALMEIKTYAYAHKKDAIMSAGKEEEIAAFISQLSQFALAKKEMSNGNLGLIGNPSNWLIASQVDFDILKQKFGISVIKIGIDELNNEINKKKSGNVPHLSTLQKKFKDKAELDKACYIYGAIKRLIKKYNLKGFSIRCFDLLSEYRSTACLALSLLNEEGIVSSCEGDLPSLLTMYIVKVLTNLNSFQANPSSFDIEKKTLMLSHCTLPLNMCKRFDLTTHFESGLGVAIKGELPLGEVTILKIAPDLKYYFAVSGELIENLSLPGYCRTQVNVQLQNDDLLMILHAQVGNHLILVNSNIEFLFSQFLYFINF